MVERDGASYQSMSAWKYKRKSSLEFVAKGKKKKKETKTHLAEEATFFLQPSASNISKIKINREDGLSWYRREKKYFSGNWGNIKSDTFMKHKKDYLTKSTDVWRCMKHFIYQNTNSIFSLSTYTQSNGIKLCLSDSHIYPTEIQKESRCYMNLSLNEFHSY